MLNARWTRVAVNWLFEPRRRAWCGGRIYSTRTKDKRVSSKLSRPIPEPVAKVMADRLSIAQSEAFGTGLELAGSRRTGTAAAGAPIA